MFLIPDIQESSLQCSWARGKGFVWGWKVESVLLVGSCCVLVPWEITKYEKMNEKNHVEELYMGPLAVSQGFGFHLCMYPRNCVGVSFNSDTVW